MPVNPSEKEALEETTEVGQPVAMISESGVLTLTDPKRSVPLWSWRATAGAHVSAAPLVGSDGTVWVAALDGSLSAVRAR